MDRAAQRSESGQAVVEAAIILPAMIFLLLLTIQLTMLQQARIAVEYAAFTAARAGIVFNGNNGRSQGVDDGPMWEAAVMAILPSYGRADTFAALARTRLRFEAENRALRPLGLSQIRVAVHNPTRRDFQGGLHQHLNGQEIDFDDVRPQVVPSTLLSLQVRYLYQLRVPFANRMIQAIWLATRIGKQGIGGLSSWQGQDLTGPKIGGQAGVDAVTLTRGAAAGRGSQPDGIPGGLNLSGIVAASSGPRPMYLMPVNAFYTMRMQSNPFLRFAP